MALLVFIIGGIIAVVCGMEWDKRKLLYAVPLLYAALSYCGLVYFYEWEFDFLYITVMAVVYYLIAFAIKRL